MSQDLLLLLLTSGRDPGIIPCNAHPPEPEGFDGSVDVVNGHTPQQRLPHVKEVEVNGMAVKIKYCPIVQYAITAWSVLTITALGLDNALGW